MVLMIGSALVLALFFAMLAAWSRPAVVIFKQNLSRPARATFTAVTLWQILQLAARWPGLISSDDLSLLQTLSAGTPSGWHSLSYSFIMQASLWISGSHDHLAILNLVFFLFLVFQILCLLPKNAPSWALLAVALLFSLPQTSVLVLFQNRDSLFTLLTVWLSLGLVAQRTDAKSAPWFRPIPLMTLALFLGDLRQEAKVFAVLVPFALWALHRPTPRRTLAAALLLVVTSGLFYALPSRFSDLDSYSRFYRSTTLINPLSDILAQRGLGELTDEDRADLGRFIDVPALIDKHDPFDIGPFHAGAVRFSATHEDFAAFERASLRIFMRNKGLFLQNRLNVIVHAMNFRGVPYAFADAGSSAPPTGIAGLHERWLRWGFYDAPPVFRLLVASCLIPGLVMLAALFLAGRRPEFFFAALPGDVRWLAIFALSPAAYFKYLTSFWLVGWLLLILWLSGTRESR